MMMLVFFIGYIMIMLVLMLDRMRVSQTIVRMSKGMLMCMFVFLCQGVDHHYNRSQNHYSKTEEVRPRWFFSKNHERQKSTDKRCYRIVCACF